MQGCAHSRPFSWMTHSFRSQNNSELFSSPYFAPCVRLLKPTMWSCFHFMFNAFHRAILNLTIVAKSILKRSFLPTFFNNPLQTILITMTLDVNAKIKIPRWSVWNALILWNLKIHGFVFVIIYLALYLQSWRKMRTYLEKLL